MGKYDLICDVIAFMKDWYLNDDINVEGKSCEVTKFS